jgi:hypothetical protein
MQFSPSSCYFLSLVFTYHQFMYFPYGKHQVSHPYKTKCKIILFYVLIFTFLQVRRENKRLWTEQKCSKCSHEFNLLLISGLKYIKKYYVPNVAVWWSGQLIPGQKAPSTSRSLESVYADIHRSSLQFLRANTRVYPEVPRLAAWSEICKWYSSLPLDTTVIPLFCESV